MGYPVVVPDVSTSEPEGVSSPIYRKILEVQKAVTGVDRVTGEEYEFFREKEVLEAIRPHLFAAGLLVTCEATEWYRDGDQVFLEFVLHVVDVETGDELVFPFPNVGSDPGDKGFNKAYTGALKYALQKLFLMPTVAVDEQEGKAKAKPQPVLPEQQVSKLLKLTRGKEKDTKLWLARANVSVPEGQNGIEKALRFLSTYQAKGLFDYLNAKS